MSLPDINTETTTLSVRRTPLWRNVLNYRFYYYLALPALVAFFIFSYVPMFGIIVAFKDVSPFSTVEDILFSPFVGFRWFLRFFRSHYFFQIMRNTIWISFLQLAWGFPAPIILALLINEVRSRAFKRVVQTISYLPHFLSMVVVAGLVMSLLTTQGGLVNQLLMALGREPRMFLGDPRAFRSVLVVTHLWQTVGWGSILYLAAIASIDQEQYEAAYIDGAGRFAQTLHITLPGMANVVVILFIFAVGNLLNAGFERILLLYSPSVYEVADIIDTYVYRTGLIGMQYSFAAAVGLFKSVIAATLLIGTNMLAKRFDYTGIW